MVIVMVILMVILSHFDGNFESVIFLVVNDNFNGLTLFFAM